METIKSSAEITRLFNEGRRANTKDISLIVRENTKQHGHHGRAAFIAGKRLGNAVWRNRAKRRLRAVCRDMNAPIQGYDLVFIAKKSTNNANYERMVTDAMQAVEKVLKR